jgi:hypothetical protein
MTAFHPGSLSSQSGADFDRKVELGSFSASTSGAAGLRCDSGRGHTGTRAAHPRTADTAQLSQEWTWVMSAETITCWQDFEGIPMACTSDADLYSLVLCPPPARMAMIGQISGSWSQSPGGDGV